MKGRPSLILVTLLMLFSPLALAEKGVLIIAHGSMKGCGYSNPTPWEQGVHEIINRIKPQVKKEIQVAFGMWNTMCFEQGIQKLENTLIAKGKTLSELEVLPLFLSSHSVVIEMQKYIFKKRASKPIPIPMAKPIKFSGAIHYLPAIDYNSHISMIMFKRLSTLVSMAKAQGFSKKQMEVFFLMHGPVGEQDNLKWLEMAERYKKDLTYLLPLGSFHIISLRDDAPTQTRDEQTRILREGVSNANTNGHAALVLPYLLSKGGIQQGILERLQGLDFFWSGEAILPSPFFEEVLMDRLLK